MMPEPTPTPEDEAPFLIFTLTKEGYHLPPTVLQEVFRATALMVQNSEPSPYLPPVENAFDAAGQFECSRVTVGFSCKEVAELKEYHNAEIWPNVQGGTPVAQWDSGMSTGCHQTLYLMEDGSFEWTEP